MIPRETWLLENQPIFQGTAPAFYYPESRVGPSRVPRFAYGFYSRRSGQVWGYRIPLQLPDSPSPVWQFIGAEPPAFLLPIEEEFLLLPSEALLPLLNYLLETYHKEKAQ